MEVVPLDLSMAFDTVSNNIVIDKLIKYGLGKWTIRWTENWLNSLAWRLMISGTKLDARHYWCIPGLILDPILFNIVMSMMMVQSTP